MQQPVPRLRAIVCGLLFVLGLALAARVEAQPGAKIARATTAGPYVVLYEKSVDDVAGATARRERAQGFRARLRYSRAVKGFAATLTQEQAERLRADPKVLSVTEDRVVTASAVVPLAPGEPLPPTGVRRIETATSSTARERSSVNVAVMDTGIDLDHPDLHAVHGKNCINGSVPADDDNGHGTHVAGTIAARNDGAGAVGVAPGTSVFAVKVLDAKGSGSTSQVICGIDWVTGTLTDAVSSNDVPVVNMSLGATESGLGTCATTSDPMHKAICASTAAGATYVVAAGNDSWDFDHPEEPDVPAAYPEVLTVTAMSDSDGRPGGLGPTGCSGDDVYAADYSNFALTGAAADHTIAGPGSCIRSTWRDGGYATQSGTSMATPHVAGAVALCLGEAGARGPCSGLRPAEIIARIRADARSRTTADGGYGFNGDPLCPAATGYFGHLVTAATSLPAVTLTQPARCSTTDDATPTFSGRAGDSPGDAELVEVDVFAGSTASGSSVRRVEATRVAEAWSATLPEALALTAGTYTARVRQRAANGDEATSAPHTFTVKAAPASAPTAEPPTAPGTAEPPTAPAAAESSPAPAAEPAIQQPPVLTAPPREPAKLQLKSARVRASRRTLEVLASITNRATGAITITFHAGGTRTRFRHTIQAGSGRQRIVRRIPRAQARSATGIVTLRYPGNARTRAQEVRLRAASRSADLVAQRPRLIAGRLDARGSVTSRARGVVRLQLDWSRDGRGRRHDVSARIRNGRWQFAASLPSHVRSDIAARDGTLHSYALFTGYGARQVRGEMRSFQVLPAP